MFVFYEETILSDGREWVLAGKKPSLADIEGEYLPILAPKGGSLDRFSLSNLLPFWRAASVGSTTDCVACVC